MVGSPVVGSMFEAKRSQIAVAVAAALALLLTLFTPTGASSSGDRSVIVWGADRAAAAAEAVEAVGGTVDRTLDLVGGVAATVDEAGERLLEAAGFRVSDNEEIHLQTDETPPREASAIYPKVIRADKVWNQGVNGDGTTVALIDTGINPVADLAGRVIGGVDFSGEEDPYLDSYGHGTFVAGIVAGNGAASGGEYKGVAPGADLVSVKIAGRTGAADVSHLLAALQWVASFKDQYSIDVVNLSLGTDATQSYETSPLNYAVEKVWQRGIVVVVAAANRGPDAGTISKPGDDPWVITVGSVDDQGSVGRNDDTVPDFSSRGPTPQGQQKPDIVAPGRSLISLRATGSTIDQAYSDSRIGNDYFRGSGTSLSTAVTAGAAALLLDREPILTPDQVKARLLDRSVAGPVGNVNVDGWGSLDVKNSVDAFGNLNSHNKFNKKSSGLGSYSADRGNLVTELVTGWDLVDGALQPVLSPLVLGLTAQNKLFNQLEFVGSTWHGSTWHTSQWVGSTWHETVWEGSTWHGSTWHGSTWH